MWACFFLAVIVISLSVVFTKRLEEIDAKISEVQGNIKHLHIGVDVGLGEDGYCPTDEEIDELRKKVQDSIAEYRTNENPIIKQEQIEEAYKRAGL